MEQSGYSNSYECDEKPRRHGWLHLLCNQSGVCGWKRRRRSLQTSVDSRPSDESCCCGWLRQRRRSGRRCSSSSSARPVNDELDRLTGGQRSSVGGGYATESTSRPIGGGGGGGGGGGSTNRQHQKHQPLFDMGDKLDRSDLSRRSSKSAGGAAGGGGGGGGGGKIDQHQQRQNRTSSGGSDHSLRFPIWLRMKRQSSVEARLGGRQFGSLDHGGANADAAKLLGRQARSRNSVSVVSVDGRSGQDEPVNADHNGKPPARLSIVAKDWKDVAEIHDPESAVGGVYVGEDDDDDDSDKVTGGITGGVINGVNCYADGHDNDQALRDAFSAVKISASVDRKLIMIDEDMSPTKPT